MNEAGFPDHLEYDVEAHIGDDGFTLTWNSMRRLKK
jgi:hypothetical protein